MTVPSLTPLKVCSKCGCTKPFTLHFFAAQKRNPSGMTGYCRICKAAYHRRYYENNRKRAAHLQKQRQISNRESISEYQRRYRKENKEAIKEYNRKYAEDNREAIRQQKRAYREANAIREAERNRRYREENKEALSEKRRRYRESNKDAIAEANRRWCKENPEARRRGQYKYYARKKNAEHEPYTDADLNQLWHDQGGRCAYCKTPLFSDYHRDHVIPLSRGGADKLENIALACPPCNIRKGARPADEFRAALKKKGVI